MKDAEAGRLKTSKVRACAGSLQGLVEMKFSIYIPKHAGMGHKRSLISHTRPHSDRNVRDKTTN